MTTLHPIHAARAERQSRELKSKVERICSELVSLGAHYEIILPDGTELLSPVGMNIDQLPSGTYTAPAPESNAPAEPKYKRRVKNHFSYTGYRNQIRTTPVGDTLVWTRRWLKEQGFTDDAATWSSFYSSVRSSAVEFWIGKGCKLDTRIVGIEATEDSVSITRRSAVNEG